MAMARLSLSDRKPTFFQRKMEAFKLYGPARSRPQESFRDFLLSKRRLNLGVTTRQQNKTAMINVFRPLLDAIPTSVPCTGLRSVNQPKFVIIDSDHLFDEMMAKLRPLHEFSLDLEMNTEHSFYGMTCLIQVGTVDMTYLIDPFPLYEKICHQFRRPLESGRVLKIMHGCANDVIALNRDFGINIVAVADTQHIFQQLAAHSFHLVSMGKFEEIKTKDLEHIMWRSVTDSRGKLMSIEFLEKLTRDLISLDTLGKLVFPNRVKPSDATFADWRIRPLDKEGMIQYAVNDVHMLFFIWQKMKLLVRNQTDPNNLLRMAFENTAKLLLKHFVPPTEDSMEVVMKRQKIIGVSNLQTLRLLYKFRQLHAKIIDESPESMLNMKDMVKIVERKPQTEEQLISYVKSLSRNEIPESLTTWSKPLFKLLVEGAPFWDKMADNKCHICDGKYLHIHLAWGCLEKYNQAAVNAFMNKPENKAYKRKEYERRKRNWMANNPGLPFPWDKKGKQ